jgi:MFS transporter, DHA1 family, inner membrane transport protein
MFARNIDSTYAPVVRKNLDRLVWGRLISNSCYRFAPPFIAVIARGLDVSVAQMGVAFMIGEFAGLASPVLGRVVDKNNRLVTMMIGMVGITAAVIAAATSTTLVQFAIAMCVMSGSKVLFDTALIVWVNDHVPYERRGRIIGVIETSWALSLFIGVAIMGLATALFSWRIGFGVGAVGMLISGGLIVAALPRDDAHAPVTEHARGTVPRNGYLVFACAFLLMGASQCLSITFGPWFEDEFNYTSAALIAVVIALGLFELVSSISSSRVTDVWGKEISVRRGAALMVASALLMGLVPHVSFVAVPMLVLFILGFEFALVSMLPLAANIVPTAGGIGLGLTVGAGTCGRAVFSTIATSLYDNVGPIGPAVTASALSAITVVAISAYKRSLR